MMDEHDFNEKYTYYIDIHIIMTETRTSYMYLNKGNHNFNCTYYYSMHQPPPWERINRTEDGRSKEKIR